MSKTLTADLLKQRQELPLDLKVRMSEVRIREWYQHYGGDVYVSYSGGKDSTVLLDIVKRMYPEVTVVFCDTGLEYPEVRQLAIKNADKVIKPKMTFKQVIERYGYPFPSKTQASYIDEYRHSRSEKLKNYRLNGCPPYGNYAISKKWRFLLDAPFDVSSRCCDVMKKNPFKQFESETNLHPFLGTMASESCLRTMQYLKYGCNAFELKRSKSTPIGFWTEQDVLRYLVENKLDYASCYGDIFEKDGKLVTTGTERTGCMFCLFGIHLDEEPNRLQKMQRNYPTQYDYCINNLGIGKFCEYVGVPYKNDQENT